MNINYSNQEMADIHYCYGLANGVSLSAQRLYRERFPFRRIPNTRTFDAIHRRLRENGAFLINNNNRGRDPIIRVNLEDDIIRYVENHPEISTRRLAAIFDVHHRTIDRIIQRSNLYPYHLQRVQALYQNDRENRINFCRWFMNQRGYHGENFSWNILYTDESQFTRNGINNFHNTHVYAYENPHAIIEGRHQIRFSLNVWGGIVANNLIGPIFLPNILNGNAYRNFLVNDLPIALEDVPIARRNRLWFMHDGAPPHISHTVRNALNRRFGNRWIGRYGPNPWPARSPDMNPLDFFFWGHLKSIVYAHPVNTVEELEQRIRDGFQTIRNMPGIFERINLSMYRRIQACLLAEGGHFEQLL